MCGFKLFGHRALNEESQSVQQREHTANQNNEHMVKVGSAPLGHAALWTKLQNISAAFLWNCIIIIL